ncbi:hypothetical protein DFQ26_006501 [Actinomortierella ambigua]|nr:hypothetical protein DFQ26_006501 [Actinomortierella ambigua]
MSSQNHFYISDCSLIMTHLLGDWPQQNAHTTNHHESENLDTIAQAAVPARDLVDSDIQCAIKENLCCAYYWHQNAMHRGPSRCQHQDDPMAHLPKDVAQAVLRFRAKVALKEKAEDAYGACKAVYQLHIEAHYTLGTMHRQGDSRHIHLDLTKAVAWFPNAAQRLQAQAQPDLSQSLAGGQGMIEKATKVAKSSHGQELYRDVSTTEPLCMCDNRVALTLPWDDVETVRLWRSSAQQGDMNAQFGQGVLCRLGQGGFGQDDRLAAWWWWKAADQGHAAAQYLLAGMYKAGLGGLERSEHRSVSWYRQAAKQGHAMALNMLATMAENGQGGLERDPVQAVQWYRQAAEHGLVQAQNNLGRMYQYGRGEGLGVEESNVDAVGWYRKAAESGCGEAQVNLGRMYQHGKGGLEQNAEVAMHWFRMAADQGLAIAQFNLGIMFQHGRGVGETSDVEAVVWYRKAALQGYAPAQNNLGWMYQHGRGVGQDDIQAVIWYSRAAEQSHGTAQSNLGWMYEYGRGVEQNYRTAVAWYQKAAAAAVHPHVGSAQTRLGLAYLLVRGVDEQSNTKALEWFGMAAKNGHAEGQFNYG